MWSSTPQNLDSVCVHKAAVWIRKPSFNRFHLSSIRCDRWKSCSQHLYLIIHLRFLLCLVLPVLYVKQVLSKKKNRPCQEDPALLCRLNYAFFFPFGIFQGSTSSMPSRCILSVWLKVQWRQAEKWGDRVTVRVCSQRIDRLFDRLPRPAQQLMFCRPFYSRCSGDFQNARRIWHFLSTNWTGSQLPRLTCC